MSQHDMVLENAGGASFRGDLNGALAALVGNNNGAVQPASTFSYMWWADTTSGLLKQRNMGNTDWIVRGSLSQGGSFLSSLCAAKSATYTVLPADIGASFICTNTWTMDFTSAATLGNGFMCAIKNNGTGIITLDPNGAETIDGQTTITLNPGCAALLVCDGAAWHTISKRGSYEGTAIASAATLNLDGVYGEMVHVTGAVGITAVTLAQGAQKVVVFDDALTMTNGASLILPGGENITTAEGDSAVFVGEGSSVARCVFFERANGTAIASSFIAFTKITASNAAWAPNPSTRKIIVRLRAGGGAGGGVSGVGGIDLIGLGGRAGAVGYEVSINVIGTYAITIGAAGTGVSQDKGNSGGDTSFIGSGISFTVAGGLGGIPNVMAGGSVQAGESGDSGDGIGGATQSAQGNGNNAAANTGAGGGGANNNAMPSSYAGGTAGSGVADIWEFA